MKYRKPQRLQLFDYSLPGWYYVTICTNDREHFFGRITEGKMKLSEIGKHAQKLWIETPNHSPQVALDEFVIMPNHIHGIVIIRDGKQIPLVGEHYDKHLAKLQSTASPDFQEFRKDLGRLQNKLLSKVISGLKLD